jgi:hypothetical protein
MKLRIVGLMCALLVYEPATSRADTITITDGQLQVAPVHGFDLGVSHLTSDQWTLILGGPAAATLSAALLPFDSVRLALTVRDFLINADGSTIDGRNHAELVAGLDLLFKTSLFQLPTSQSNEFRFQVPFTMVVRLSVVDPQGTFRFVTDVAGAGTLDVFAGLSTNNGTFGFRTGTVVFASSPAPTPEPTTLLTLATGLVLIGRRYALS